LKYKSATVTDQNRVRSDRLVVARKQACSPHARHLFAIWVSLTADICKGTCPETETPQKPPQNPTPTPTPTADKPWLEMFNKLNGLFFRCVTWWRPKLQTPSSSYQPLFYIPTYMQIQVLPCQARTLIDSTRLVFPFQLTQRQLDTAETPSATSSPGTTAPPPDGSQCVRDGRPGSKQSGSPAEGRRIE